jgi:hypothetical protein
MTLSSHPVKGRAREIQLSTVVTIQFVLYSFTLITLYILDFILSPLIPDTHS